MVEVLGIKLFNSTINEAYSDLKNIIHKHSPKINRLVSATGAHGLVMAQKDAHFRNILNEFYINLPDGVPGVWIGKLKGNNNMQVCAGPDFFEYVLKESSKHNDVRHFFCGGKPGVAEDLKKVCLEKFHNANVVGTFSPPFREMTASEMTDLGNQIKSVKADIVWIGLGTPKQEKFAYRLREFTSTHFIITVGAAFDFHTGKVKYAPNWMQKNGLGWFFRLLMEPKRLIARYAETVPLFIYFNLKEFFSPIYLKIAKTVRL